MLQIQLVVAEEKCVTQSNVRDRSPWSLSQSNSETNGINFEPPGKRRRATLRDEERLKGSNESNGMATIKLFVPGMQGTDSKQETPEQQ